MLLVFYACSWKAETNVRVALFRFRKSNCLWCFSPQAQQLLTARGNAQGAAAFQAQVTCWSAGATCCMRPLLAVNAVKRRSVLLGKSEFSPDRLWSSVTCLMLLRNFRLRKMACVLGTAKSNSKKNVGAVVYSFVPGRSKKFERNTKG